MVHNSRCARPAGARSRTRRDCAVAYLNARLSDAGREELAAVLCRIAQACGGVALAEKVELSSDVLYRTLSQRGNPELKAAAILLRAMGLRLVLQPIGAH